MKKPMLGILAICFMQMAFVAYNAIELPIDTLAVAPVRISAPASVDLNTTQDDIVSFRSRSQIVATSADRVPRPTAANFVPVRRSPKAATPTPARPRTMSAKTIQPRIRNDYPALWSESGELDDKFASSTAAKAAKKKGFFAKAFPIIKKPYDWAKAFAGKLK